MKKIVVVHGVGNPVLGSVIGSVTATDCQVYNKSSLSLDGITYPTLSELRDAGLTLIEVNWSDIRRPLSSKIGIVRHLAALLIAMLFLSQHWPAENKKRIISFTGLNRWFTEAILIWAAFLPAYTILLISTTGAGRIAIVAIYSALSAAIVILRRSYSSNIIFGLFWTLIYLLLGTLWGIYANRDDILQFLTTVSIQSYGISQFISGTLLTFVFIEGLFLSPGTGQTLIQRLSRLSFAYIPVIAISIIGPVLMSLVLKAMDKGKYAKWKDWFYKGLFYDLAAGELVMTACLSILGLLPVIGVTLYFIGPWSYSGTFTRKWLAVILVASPLILLTGGWVILGDSLGILHIPTLGLNDPLEIYKYSALRIMPFITLIIGPTAIMLDVIGDIVFYLLPTQHVLSIQKETRSRLSNILGNLAGDKNISELIILAHSQGSVISADVLNEYHECRVKLITIGSPIDSLYEHFLGVKAGNNLEKQRCQIQWVNLFRTGDYIGGAIQEAGKDECIGPGGHINYWNDPKVLQELSGSQ